MFLVSLLVLFLLMFAVTLVIIYICIYKYIYIYIVIKELLVRLYFFWQFQMISSCPCAKNWPDSNIKGQDL